LLATWLKEWLMGMYVSGSLHMNHRGGEGSMRLLSQNSPLLPRPSFCRIGRNFLRKTKQKAGVASLISIAAASLCQMAQAGVLCPTQDQVIATVKGKVTSGFDTSGEFGEPNTVLTGKDYLLIYIIYCGAGSQVQPNSYSSSIDATSTSYPISATLTIDGVTVSSGFGPNSFVFRDTRAPSTGGDAVLQAWPVMDDGDVLVRTTIWFTDPPAVVDPCWARRLHYQPAPTNYQSGANFSMNSPEGYDGASGALSVTSIVISGPKPYTTQ
jgi:hypothetical protein